MEYNETVKKLERSLVRHESGAVSIGAYTLPKGLCHRQYIGIVAMLKGMEMEQSVMADVPYNPVSEGDVKVMIELANELMGDTRIQ